MQSQGNQARASQARRAELVGDEVCRLQVAALPWRRRGDDIEILLITSRDTGRWVLPKGWAEKREKPWRAAAREAVEEAGIDGDVSHREAGSYRYAKITGSGDQIPCQVAVYPLMVEKIADKWKECRQRTRMWVSAAEASLMVSEPDLRTLIATFGATQSETTDAR